jgi:putative transcriptional regulator
MTVIERARAYRRAQGLTQAEFAERFGVPLQTYRQWENGRRRPDKASENLLCIILAAPDVVARVVKQCGSRGPRPYMVDD